MTPKLIDAAGIIKLLSPADLEVSERDRTSKQNALEMFTRIRDKAQIEIDRIRREMDIE